MRKVLALCGLLVVGTVYSMEKEALETSSGVEKIEIGDTSYVVSDVRIDSTTSETIKVVDRFGWKGLSLKDQVKRARVLGEHYNSYNSGPDYLNVESELHLGVMLLKK